MYYEEYLARLRDPRWLVKADRIRRRDNFTCQYCGKHGWHVHHILPNYESPWDVPDDYLVTLCEACHKIEHLGWKDARDMLILSIWKRFDAHFVRALTIAVKDIPTIKEGERLQLNFDVEYDKTEPVEGEEAKRMLIDAVCRLILTIGKRFGSRFPRGLTAAIETIPTPKKGESLRLWFIVE